MNWQATKILINVEDIVKKIENESTLMMNILFDGFFLFEEKYIVRYFEWNTIFNKRWMDTPVIGLNKCKLIEFDYL